uniref:Zinc finger GRF-type domain-containing protein n=1 Tax=Hordeum vulgare subsp. vulgare TaxID=112509 RepID=A0A8I7B8H9_HORVV
MSPSSSFHGRGRPFIHLIDCPGACGSFVMKHVSSTEDHPGWVYYRCPGHGNGCNFWHWEREYVAILVKKKFLTGANVVDAIGWSEDTREELERRNEQRRARAGFIRGPCSEERMNASLLQVGRQIVLLLKIVVGVGVLLCMMCLMLVMKLWYCND